MTAASESIEPWPSRSYAWYVTVLLTSAYTFSFVDRQVLNLLVIPIRADLGFTDTQVSLLQGVAFVVPYVLLSIPLGRWVDLTSRTRVLVTGLLFWTVSCIACGLARVPWQATAARMGVGIGEAAVTPASWSLLADYFPPSKRAVPLSVFLMGPYLGGGMALILGGQLLDWAHALGPVQLPLVGVLAPWQFVFVLVGLPGFALALLLLTIAEPARRGVIQRGDARGMSLRDAHAFVKAHWTLYSAFLIGVPFLVIVLYALQAWIPTFLVRVYQMDLAVAGRTYGVIALVSGSVGVLSGPVASTWLQRRGHDDAPLRLGVISIGLLLPCVILAPLQGDSNGALLLIAAASFFVTLPMSMFVSALQSVTPNELRGLIAGLYVFAVSGLGFALGPTGVALLTDYVFHDPAAVGHSLAIVCGVAGLIALWVLVRAMPAYRTEYRNLLGKLS